MSRARPPGRRPGAGAPAPAATITLADDEIVVAGRLEEADRVAVGQRVGRWCAATGRGDLVPGLDRVHGDGEAAKRILNFLGDLTEAGLALTIEVDPRDPCPAAAWCSATATTTPRSSPGSTTTAAIASSAATAAGRSRPPPARADGTLR